MFFSLISQSISVLILPFAFECVQIITNFHHRARVYRLSSMFNSFAGFSMGLAVSWYANLVISEYWHHSDAGNYRYLWGRALYLGWINMSILICLSIVTCIT